MPYPVYEMQEKAWFSGIFLMVYNESKIYTS